MPRERDKAGAMSVFARFADVLKSTAGSVLATLVEAVRTTFEGEPATRRRVAFSVAMIALSAKMAKADGIVTDDEIAAFYRIFSVPVEERANVARLYNLARQDVAGYEAYATRMAAMCGSGEADCPILEDILDGLFHIAKADGVIHENELGFLESVATIFGLTEARYETVLARHVETGKRDPYTVLGIDRSVSLTEARKAWASL